VKVRDNIKIKNGEEYSVWYDIVLDNTI